MIVEVHMMAFHDYTWGTPVIREVHVPDGEWNAQFGIPTRELDLVFHYGQNEIQCVPERCSVSCGDVIELNGNFWLVCGMGFRRLLGKEFFHHLNLPREKRSLSAMGAKSDL